MGRHSEWNESRMPLRPARPRGEIALFRWQQRHDEPTVGINFGYFRQSAVGGGVYLSEIETDTTGQAGPKRWRTALGRKKRPLRDDLLDSAVPNSSGRSV